MAWETMRPLSHDHRDGGKPRVALVRAGEGHAPEMAVRLSEPALIWTAAACTIMGSNPPELAPDEHAAD